VRGGWPAPGQPHAWPNNEGTQDPAIGAGGRPRARSDGSLPGHLRGAQEPRARRLTGRQWFADLRGPAPTDRGRELCHPQPHRAGRQRWQGWRGVLRGGGDAGAAGMAGQVP